MSIELIIHGTGNGLCALSGKEGEGIVVSFKDGTLREGFLSHRAFQQLIKMKFAQGGGTAAPGAGKPAAPPHQSQPAVPMAAAVAAGNGAK